MESRGLIRRASILLVATALALAGLPMLSAKADSHLSRGCQVTADSPAIQTSVWTFYHLNGIEFFAGEVISATFSEPHLGDVTGVTLHVDGEPLDAYELVDQDGFPGSVSYVIPADGLYRFSFAVHGTNTGSGLNATIHPDCQGAAPPTPDFCDSGRVFGEFHSSLAQAGELNHKPGSHYGFASCNHGTDFNKGKKLGPRAE